MTCAVVIPLLNLALWSTGGQATYTDMGDRIAYGRPVPAIVRVLTEHRTGTTPRWGCEVKR